VGFTAFSERAGEEAAYTLMQRISGLMTEMVHQQRGTVKSFTGDGIMALFGFPVALEDAPLRACRAARFIQQRLASEAAEIEAKYHLRPQLRIGINTGPVIVGKVESGDSTAVTALGDTVNLASRLQSLAEANSVLLSETTYRLVKDQVEVSTPEEHAIKGKTERQRVFRLERVREGASRFEGAVSRGLTTYVGRARELETLERCLSESANGVRVVDIVGEAGIGKSRLLHEFRTKLGDRRIFVLSGSCSPDGQQTPFLPFVEIVRTSFRVSIGESQTDVARKLEKGLTILGLASDESLGLLLNLLGLKVANGALRGMDGVVIGLRTRELLLKLLEERCRIMPVVMVLEDLHWIDSASQELLGRLIAKKGRLPLLILCTHRSEYKPAWTDESAVTNLSLEPLSRAETSEIVQARLGVVALPGTLALLVAEKADGNPLFAEEITSYLVERGVVRHAGRGVEYDAASVAKALPASLQSLLTARIDRLASEDRTLLQAASAIGRRFSSDLLAAVTASEATISSRLAVMQALDLIYVDSKSEECAFKHALVRDALYNSLLEQRRSGLHLTIAEELERRGHNRLDEIAESLAHHYGLTRRSDKAFTYLALSGRKALHVYSIRVAEQYFRAALEIAQVDNSGVTESAIADVVVHLLEVLLLTSDFRGLKSLAESYIARIESLGDTPELVLVLHYHSQVLVHLTDFRGGVRSAEKALAVAERLNDDRSSAYARAAVLYSSTPLGLCPLDVAVRMGTQALAEAERAGDDHMRIWIYHFRAWDYLYRGMTKEARDCASKLIEAGRENGDRRALGLALWALGFINIVDERYDDALANAEECLEVCLTRHDHAAGSKVKAMASLLRDRTESSLHEIRKLSDEAQAEGWLYLDSATIGFVGVGLALTGHLSQGIRLLETCVSSLEKLGDRAQACWQRVILAEIYIQILAGTERPSVRVLLQNVGAIITATLFGARRAQGLLERASQLEQFDERGAMRARIKADFGVLYIVTRRPILARQFLEQARAVAELQGAAAIVAKADAALASLAARS
jgi:class 3 adenylate cyclase/tetratricopeptide (TPR) repeat protein